MVGCFLMDRNPEYLKAIYRHFGLYGLTLACKLAHIPKWKGKQMVGICGDGTIHYVAKACGLKQPRIWR
jgi:hypothetical protein